MNYSSVPLNRMALRQNSEFGQLTDVMIYKKKPVKQPVKKASKPVKKVSKPVKKAVIKKATVSKNTGKTTTKKTAKVTKITNSGQIPQGGNGVVIQVQPNSNESPVVVQKQGNGLKDSLLGLASQMIAGFSTRETIQTSDGQIPLYPLRQNQTVLTGGGLDTSEYEQNQQSKSNIEDTADTLGGGINGLFEWGRQNLGLVALFGVGVYLLMKPPPQYGNKK